jgi:hypothetical protein
MIRWYIIWCCSGADHPQAAASRANLEQARIKASGTQPP